MLSGFKPLGSTVASVMMTIFWAVLWQPQCGSLPCKTLRNSLQYAGVKWGQPDQQPVTLGCSFMQKIVPSKVCTGLVAYFIQHLQGALWNLGCFVYSKVFVPNKAGLCYISNKVYDGGGW
jgi:hypothetical protein